MGANNISSQRLHSSVIDTPRSWLHVGYGPDYILVRLLCQAASGDTIMPNYCFNLSSMYVTAVSFTDSLLSCFYFWNMPWSYCYYMKASALCFYSEKVYLTVAHECLQIQCVLWFLTLCLYCCESIERILCDYSYHCEGNPSFWQLSASRCCPYVQAMAVSKSFCRGDRLGPINTNEIQTG